MSLPTIQARERANRFELEEAFARSKQRARIRAVRLVFLSSLCRLVLELHHTFTKN